LQKRPKKRSARNRSRKEERQTRFKGESVREKQLQQGKKSLRIEKRKELKKQESISRM
jgi:hypothetical protein